MHIVKLAYMFASKIMFLVCIHQRKYFICVYLLQLWNCIHIFACKSGSNIILYFTVWMCHLFSYTRSQFAFHVYYLPAEFVNVCLCPSACFYQTYISVFVQYYLSTVLVTRWKGSESLVCYVRRCVERVFDHSKQ